MSKSKFLTIGFYGLIGFLASLLLFLVFYWNLRLNASIENLILNFYDAPLYFWPYVLLTVGTLILFGVNVSLLIYRWRKYGLPKLAQSAGGGLGAIVGVLASACPICGSTLLALVGITGGLAVFPLRGLELKGLSFILMVLPIWLTAKELSIFQRGGKGCPVPQDPSFRKSDRLHFVLTIGLIAVGLILAREMLRTDPAIIKLWKHLT